MEKFSEDKAGASRSSMYFTPDTRSDHQDEGITSYSRALRSLPRENLVFCVDALLAAFGDSSYSSGSVLCTDAGSPQMGKRLVKRRLGADRFLERLDLDEAI